MVKVRVPASTSNLGSGFDTFGLALQLYLTVEMEISAAGTHFEIEGAGADEISTGPDNLILRAATRLFEKTGTSFRGLKIRIQNEIPLCRGLGSSGAATVAGLLCGAKLCNAHLSRQEILTIAYNLERHPENAAAALFGGLTINCIDRGQVITRKSRIGEDLRAVLLIPEIGVSTTTAREVLPKQIPHEAAVFNVQRSVLLAHAFASKEYELLKIAMQDQLHQPYRKHLIPHYDEFEAAAYENEALGVCISGSGSTILAFTLSDHLPLEEAWKRKAEALKMRASVRTVAFDQQGARFV